MASDRWIQGIGVLRPPPATSPLTGRGESGLLVEGSLLLTADDLRETDRADLAAPEIEPGSPVPNRREIDPSVLDDDLERERDGVVGGRGVVGREDRASRSE